MPLAAQTMQASRVRGPARRAKRRRVRKAQRLKGMVRQQEAEALGSASMGDGASGGGRACQRRRRVAEDGGREEWQEIQTLRLLIPTTGPNRQRGTRA